MCDVSSLGALRSIYGAPAKASLVKEANLITSHYRAYIEASPFAVLSTNSHEGLDCSPRGGPPGFVSVRDSKTLLLPDRLGNNRLDSLSNIIADARVGLLFLIPGVSNTLRVKGRAAITTESELVRLFAIEDKVPRTVIVVTVTAVYFQCTRAISRADLWNGRKHVDPKSLPTAGQILAALSNEQIRATEHDARWQRVALD